MGTIMRVAIFLLPVFILLPHMNEFVFQPGAQYSDMLISHYPNGVFLQKVVLEQGVVPLWSTTILSGYPFFANPLSGLAYFPGWLAFLLPLPFGFNLNLGLHLVGGGLGMYLLLRREGLVEAAALLGALAFATLPKIYGHIGAGHLTLVYAVAWTPWILYIEKRASTAGWLGWFLPGAGLGMLALADVRWAAYAGLLWISFSAREYFNHKVRPGLLFWTASRLGNLVMAGLISAPLLLPLAQYAQLATRSQMTVQESLVLSLPPARLLGLVFPDIGGSAEWQLYPGAVVLALTLAAGMNPLLRRKVIFWIYLVVASLIFAMGEAIPFFERIASLPGISLLRVPPRALLLGGFGFAVLAAHALNSLVAFGRNRRKPGSDRSDLILFGLAAFFGFLAIGMFLMVDQVLLRVKFAWGAFFFATGVLLIWLARKGSVREEALVVLFISACMIDLLGVNGLSLSFLSPDDAISQGRETAVYLTEREGSGKFRVYSPSYSISQAIAAERNLELADGVDPLQLSTYVDFMTRATGVPNRGYSVTLPPFASANPTTDNRDYNPDPDLLGLLNIRYVVAEFPLQDDQLILLKQTGSTWIYQNLAERPRAWVQPAASNLGENIDRTPQVNSLINRIEVRAQGPGLLVLSEIIYPGWEVWLDGEKARIENVGGLLRGVQIGEGEHLAVFIFRPYVLYIGLALAGLSWMIVLAAAAIFLKNKMARKGIRAEML